MKDKKVRLERAHNVVDGLEIKSGISIDQLREIAARFVEEDIYFEPAVLPSSISGFSIRSRQGPYVVFYDQFRHGEARNLVLTHELAHLIQGDATNLDRCDFEEAIQVVMTGKEAPNILCRNTFTQNPEAEKQIEFIATLLLQKLVADDECQPKEITLAGLKDIY